MYTPEQLAKITRTARSAGAVGKDPLTYRAFRSWYMGEVDSSGSTKYPYGDPDRCTNILDFGCGPKQVHIKKLRAELPTRFAVGFDLVQDPDVPDREWFNFEPETKFDCIIASNVLNVQPSLKHIDALFAVWKSLLAPMGIVIANYPKGPRHSDVTQVGVWAASDNQGLTAYSGSNNPYPGVNFYLQELTY